MIACLIYLGVGIYFLASGHATEIRRSSSFTAPVHMEGTDARIYGVIIMVTGLVFLTLTGIRLNAELTGQKVPELTDESDHYW